MYSILKLNIHVKTGKKALVQVYWMEVSKGGCKLHFLGTGNTHSCEEGMAAALPLFPKSWVIQMSSCISPDRLLVKVLD